MWPVFWSSSYFAREPRGISTKTSTCLGFALVGIRPPWATVRRRDDDRDLPLRAIGSIPSSEVLRRSAHELLVDLRELARDHDARVRRDGREVLEEVGGAERALVHDDRPALGEERPERLPPLAALLREEPEERERPGREARRDERSDGRCGPGDRRHGVAGGDGRDDERFARIGGRRPAGNG